MAASYNLRTKHKHSVAAYRKELEAREDSLELVSPLPK